jgi:hypothetical protein
MNINGVASRLAAGYDNRLSPEDIGTIDNELSMGSGMTYIDWVLKKYKMTRLKSVGRNVYELSYGNNLPIGNAVLKIQDDQLGGVQAEVMTREIPDSVLIQEKRVLGIPDDVETD